jgi:hypothetical protein
MRCPKCNKRLPQVTGRIRCSCGNRIEEADNSFSCTIKNLEKEPPRVECPNLLTNPDTQLQSCSIVESICNIQHLPTASNCQACTRCTHPQKVNEVTVGISIQLLQEQGQEYEYLLPALSIDTLQGPGTTLKKMLSWFITKPPNCSCSDRAELMDVWGPDKCKENIRTILGWLRESALDNNYPYSEFLIKYMIELAISLSRLSPRNKSS